MARLLHASWHSLIASWHSLVATWTALQVERQGKYSLERLRQLHEYQSSTSLTRAWTVIVLTPLPCLVIISLLDAIPLQPPSLGFKHSQWFWLRSLVMSVFVYIAVMVQLRLVVTRLLVTRAQILWIPCAVAMVTVALTISTAYLVAYPLPFAIALGSPVSCVIFALCIYATWGTFLKENADIRSELQNYFTLVVKQVSLLYIYALFGYAFNSLSSIDQMVCALLLPILKLACKNYINRSVLHQEDRKPEMIVFNVEIFHTLNVAFSMQNAASVHTIAVLMALDFFHAISSLRRFNRLAKALPHELRVRSGGEIPVSVVGNAAKAWRGRVLPLRDSNCVDNSAPRLLRVEFLILDAKRIGPSSNRIVSISSRPKPPLNCGPLWTSSTGSKEKFSESKTAKTTKPPSALRPSTAEVSLSIPASSRLANLQSNKLESSEPPSVLTNDEARTMSSLRPLEHSCEQSQIALQLLHMTEFFVLIEYTEVMIPAVYCLYLLVMRHLPNRVYYAQLKDVDDAKLQQNISNILLYALLELVSFLVLSWYLDSKLRISAIHQLAFVLEHQWHMVQSKFIVWVVLTVQSSLEHFGADYSFQFKWLHARDQP